MVVGRQLGRHSKKRHSGMTVDRVVRLLSTLLESDLNPRDIPEIGPLWRNFDVNEVQGPYVCKGLVALLADRVPLSGISKKHLRPARNTILIWFRSAPKPSPSRAVIRAHALTHE